MFPSVVIEPPSNPRVEGWLRALASWEHPFSNYTILKDVGSPLTFTFNVNVLVRHGTLTKRRAAGKLVAAFVFLS